MKLAMPLVLSVLTVSSFAASPQPHAVVPSPAELRLNEGRLPVTDALSVAVRGQDTPRLRAEITRVLTLWQQRTGLTFAHAATGGFVIGRNDAATEAGVVIDCSAASPAIPVLGEDESYSIEVTSRQAVVRAGTVVGGQRGLQTLLQLLQSDAQGWFIPAVEVQDRPRFPWRGLMIDVCRHWQPLDVIKRNLDGMALVKLNVLHLHLTEDQGFRIESRRFPRLQEEGSDGHFFTQEQMRELIAYAADRGIRVVPEFDIPGHATSWVVAFPELASAPGPYVIERDWGVFDPVLDPTNEKTYELLDGFLGEMAALFPDPYIHIGGDENNGVQWKANVRIQAFIRDHGLKDNAGLHAYFNQRIREILGRHGKKMVGWDEILHPDLPKDSVIHSWRGAKGLAEAAGKGFSTILSNGYYIDLCHSASEHYRNDPLPADTTLPPEVQGRILGGEATMWSEWVTPETIDSRIWPRTAAIAERLWSPREVNDVPDMYRRLAVVSRWLEDAGLQHERNRPAMVRRYAGESNDEELVWSLGVLVDVVEPVEGYLRRRQQPDARQFTPLTGLVDCARPESDTARAFRDNVATLLAAPTDERAAASEAVTTTLQEWQTAAEYIVAHAGNGPPRLAAEAVPLAEALAGVAKLGLEVTEKILDQTATDEAWRASARTQLEAAGKAHAAVELPMIKAVDDLIQATRESTHPDKP